MKKVKFFTLGCKVNQYDTQSIREDFFCSGYKESLHNEAADVYVVNTCTVTGAADRDSLYYIRRSYRENPHARIIVTGCLAQLDQDRIKSEPGVVFIVKNKDKKNIVSLLSGGSQKKNAQSLGNISSFNGHTRTFLKIQDGCNNFCSYCKVPLVRGRSRSKKIENIVIEANTLVKNGFKEIVLSGICLGSYGRDLKGTVDLVAVIDELEKIDGLHRIRLSSIESIDVTGGLISRLSSSGKLCPHLHIPLQSGDDKILKLMNRKYTAGGFLSLIKKIRREIPKIALTTDILVGFPGESRLNFLNTVRLIKKIKPLKVHIFPFSARNGTAACLMDYELTQDDIKERIEFLREVAQVCSISYISKFIHKKVDVLVEGQVKGKPDLWEGHTDNYIKVNFYSKVNLSGRIVRLVSSKISDDVLLADMPALKG